MRIYIFFIVLIAALFANVDPFVVQNTTKLNQNHTIMIPLPKEQLVYAGKKKANGYSIGIDEKIKVIIKPKETLYILSDENNTDFMLEYSLDGRVFQSMKPKFLSPGHYRFTNESTQTAALSLSSSQDVNVSLYTTYSPSDLNHYKGKAVSLPGKKKQVVSEFNLRSELYDYFGPQQEFSFDIKGPGMMVLVMRGALMGMDSFSTNRQRILLKVNDEPYQTLDALSHESWSYMAQSETTRVSNESRHFIPLHQKDNHITIKTNGAILLKGDVYRDNTLNSTNDLNLSWEFSNDFSLFNQPHWKNSVRDGGINRMEHLLSYKSKIVDTVQQRNLEKNAKLSTFMKQMEPTYVPKNTKRQEAYFPMYHLYRETNNLDRSIFSQEDVITKLSDLKRATFVDVPLWEKQKSKRSHLHTFKKIYFDPSQEDNDRHVAYQVLNAVQKVPSYDRVHLYGCLDRQTHKIKNNIENILDCQIVQDTLITAGISKQNIVIEREKVSEKSEHDLSYIEMKLAQWLYEPNTLEYRFDKPLEREREIEITFLSNEHTPKKLLMDINGKSWSTLEFKPDEVFKPFVFSRALHAYGSSKNLYRTDPSRVLATLDGMEIHSFSENTGTIRMILPKGTKILRLSRDKRSNPFKIALKIRQSSVYKDTPFSLAYQYHGTYEKFATTLEQKQLSGQKFDPWYEHTHPLRLWFNAQLSQAKRNMNNSSIPSADVISIMNQALDYKDYFTAKQIAKHALMLSKNTNIQDQAFESLIKFSQGYKEQLMWHAVYFVKRKTPQALKKIAALLCKEGNYKLALDILLLLDRRDVDIKELSKLALLENEFVLFRYLTENKLSNDPIVTLKEKEHLLKQRSYRTSCFKNDVKVHKNAGNTAIYTENRDTEFSYHKTSAEQEVEMIVEGPKVLHFDIRFSSVLNHHRWLKIVHNEKEVYHYPVTQVLPSSTLKDMSESRPISIGNQFEIVLPKGMHKLQFYGYEEPFLLGVRSREAIEGEIKPLNKQILQTSGNRLDEIVEGPKESTLPYVSALLWNYDFGTVSNRYHAQAQAYLLKDMTYSKDVEDILGILTFYSSFSKYVSTDVPLGFYDEKTPVWHPNSEIQKSRSPLLRNIKHYDTVVYGDDYTMFKFDGEQNVTLEVEQITPKYFPYAPLKLMVCVDEENENYVEFNQSRESWTSTIHFSEGSHSIRLRMISPFSTHYLGINIYQNGKRINERNMIRYFKTSHQQPVVIHEEGPMLLRVEEKLRSGEVYTYYRYLEEPRLYHEKITPSVKHESLVRISKMIFDPFKISLSSPEWEEEQVVGPKLINDEPQTVFLDTEDEEGIYFESLDPTWSFELGFSRIDLASDDDIGADSKSAVQIGVYRRSRLDDDTYIKQHLFARMYEDDPLFGFQNKLYSKVPFANMWIRADLNGYVQKFNDFNFRNMHLNFELFKKEPLASNWVHSYGMGAFKYFLHYQPVGSGILDPLVYSDYKEDHQKGLNGQYELFYHPYDDLMVSYNVSARSNEDFTTIDSIRQRFTFYEHINPFDLSLYYEKRNYFEDDDRDQDYDVSTVGGRVRYEAFFDTERLELALGFEHKIESSSFNFFINSVWHFSHNRHRYHFMPDEMLFPNLKDLLLATQNDWEQYDEY